MHCVSARTRSKRALIDTLLPIDSTTAAVNSPVSEVVDLSSGDEEEEEEEYETVIDFGDEEEVNETGDSDFNAMQVNDDDVVIVVSDDNDNEFDSEVQLVKEVTANEDGCGNVGRIEVKRGRGRPRKEELEGVIGGGVRRRRALGLDILIDDNNSHERKCAAQRTRSHFRSNNNNNNNNNNKKENKLKLGTIAQPICIDDNDDDEEEEEKDDREEEEEKDDFDDHTQDEEASGEQADKESDYDYDYDYDYDSESESESEYEYESESESESEYDSESEPDEQYSSGSKRKGHACVLKKGKKLKKKVFDVNKIIKDSIYGKGEVPLMLKDQEPNPCADSPTKFTFLLKGPKEAEKPEEEEERLEPIWAEMEHGLDDTPDPCVSGQKREAFAITRKKLISPKFSLLLEDQKATEKSEQENELEQLWAEMERDLNGTPDSLVSGDKREAFTLSKKKHISPKFSFLHNDPKATDKSENGLEPIWAERERGLNDTPDSWGSGHKRETTALPRKKHSHGDPKDFAVHNVLQDYIYGEGAVPLEEPINIEPNPIKGLMPAFPFWREEPKPPEKSDEEKELDQLWAQMDLALYALQENSCPASQVQNIIDSDNDQCQRDEVNVATLCRQGKHHLILNEEIGLICTYCLHVGLDIKDYIPPMSERPFGKSSRRESYNEDHVRHSVFNDFQDRVSGCHDDSRSNYTGTVWNIIPGVKKNMYPHQCEAFEFLWENLAGGIFLDKLKEQEDFNGGGGCVISHSPGTGKTRLTITFLQTYMKLYPKCRSMIIAPAGMLLTWEEEFRKWNIDIPFHNLNNPDYSGKESEVAMDLVTNSGCNVDSRLVKLYSWKYNRSILGISYPLFEQKTREDCPDKEMRKFLLEHPSLLVLDEGHTPRNSQSRLFKAVSQVRTKKRIILSGTPFQNNFRELYNTFDLARPKFAEWNPYGGKELFSKMRGRPGKENAGKWRHLSKSILNVADDSRKFNMLNKIRNTIRPFVHVYKGTVLQDSLPGMKEFVVILKPTQLQKELFEDLQKRRESLDPHAQKVLKIDYEESVTAVHPALFGLSEGKGKFERLRLNPEESVKTNFLMELIRLCELLDEKVLVFSQYVEPLKLMVSQLKHHYSWTEGREVLYLHGKVNANLRQASIKSFNNPNSNVRVMLASTKATYEGISLVGASRVVLLDIVWNPSVERQAISRAYRLGQKKFVYTYQMITAGTKDEEKCSRQAVKDQLSEFVFFNSDWAQKPEKIVSAELEDRVLEAMVQHEKFRHVFEKVAIKNKTLL